MTAEKIFSKLIIEWYEQHKRALPWRETHDPYKIWLSEIILQQTRVNQGLPYYLKFIEKYPTVFDLAAASEQEVLRLWQGLGYYSRARNLYSCSKYIVQSYNGIFPNNYNELLTLKGIGTYTAAAIASFAFAEAVPVVDGNVFRVLARHFGISNDISAPATKTIFIQKASECIPHGTPAIFNQAIMEFGALHCTPQSPNCDNCPIKRSCVAFSEESQNLYPVKTKKTVVRKRYFYYLVFEHKGKLLLKQRGPKDIWQGLFDFYLIESKRTISLENLKQSNTLLKNLPLEVPTKVYKHVLSHQHLFARFIYIRLNETDLKENEFNTNSLSFYSKKQIADLPKPVLVSRYLEDIGFFTKR